MQIEDLYTRRLDFYRLFIQLFRAPEGFEALLRRSNLLRPGLRVMDAGCGFGMATFALLKALSAANLDYDRIDAFDLTAAMLERFKQRLDDAGRDRIRFFRANVLNLESLPHSWQDYDLVLSTSMLEYLPPDDLPHALEALRARMAPASHLLAMITRKSLETKIMIEWGWHAQRYTKPDLQKAFRAAGFERLWFLRFPLRYFWLNRANYVVLAEKAEREKSGGGDV
jgi:SAM-dependent methyltransferase